MSRRLSVLAQRLSPHGRSGLEGQERKSRDDDSSKFQDRNQVPAEPWDSETEHLRIPPSSLLLRQRFKGTEREHVGGGKWPYLCSHSQDQSPPPYPRNIKHLVYAREVRGHGPLPIACYWEYKRSWSLNIETTAEPLQETA